MAAQISQATTCCGPFDLAGFQQVQHDLVVGHQHEARLVDDRRVAQFFVRVLGGEDRHGGLVDGRPAHAGVQVAGRERRGRDAAEPGATVRRVHERQRPPHVFRRQPAGEVERGAGDVRVDVDAAGKDDHPGRVDRAPAFDVGDDAAVGDADVLDDAVDAVRRIVDLAAGNPKHGCRSVSRGSVSRARAEGIRQNAVVTLVHGQPRRASWPPRPARMRRTTSSSVGYGDLSTGRSGSGISSMR